MFYFVRLFPFSLSLSRLFVSFSGFGGEKREKRSLELLNWWNNINGIWTSAMELAKDLQSVVNEAEVEKIGCIFARLDDYTFLRRKGLHPAGLMLFNSK
ncbi:MAG: hypothetical protein ACTS6G_03450 [Candidatus Hodgkinia cicadicola]